MTKPTVEAWRSLYKAAEKFKALAPWTWMCDSDIFGVEDPVAREIGYCCVMGRNKEHYGMAVYLGTQGLENLCQVQAGLGQRDPETAFYLMKALTVSFEDRRSATREDLQVVKALGLKFRGNHAWPMFRSYEPGYRPWYLTAEQAAYLTLCLQHASDIAVRFRQDPKLLRPHEGGHFFVRCFEYGGSNNRWVDERRAPSPLTRVIKMTKQIPRDQLARIKQFPCSEGSIWEIDLFPLLAQVKEAGERPYVPICILFVDQASNFVFHFHAMKYGKHYAELIDQFLKTIENVGLLPSQIHVRDVSLLAFLEPLAKELSIFVKHVKRCRAIERARKSMREFFALREK